MILNSLGDLRSTEEHLVIINVNTKLLTTLSLLSALKHAEMPVLIIDCQSTDGSYKYFSNLMKTFDFDIISAPLIRHGAILDWLFTHLPSKKVLIMHSDVELLNSEILGVMRRFIDDEKTFGCGFVEGPGRMSDDIHPPDGYFEERFWDPIVMLKTSMVQEAMREGCSFVAKTFFNDFGPSQFISRMLRIRYHLPIFRKLRLSGLNPFKRSFHGYKPSYVVLDTGAEVYQYLKHQKGYLFVGFPAYFGARYVAHFQGVTRLLLNPKDRLGTSLDSIEDTILKRLKETYGFTSTSDNCR